MRFSTREPNWSIQDVDYLRAEARRMANVARNQETGKFPLPRCFPVGTSYQPV